MRPNQLRFTLAFITRANSRQIHYNSNATFLEAISKSIASDSNLDAHFVLPPCLSGRRSLMTDPGRHLSSAGEVLPRSNGTRPGPCTGHLCWLARGAQEGWGLDTCFQSVLVLEEADVCGGAAALPQDPGRNCHPGQPLAAEVAPLVHVVTPSTEWRERLRGTLLCLPRLGGLQCDVTVNTPFITRRPRQGAVRAEL